MSCELSLRACFPQFQAADGLIYLDSAATSHKPQVVIDRTLQFYVHENANVHRASYQQAAQTTARFEQARQQVQAFIGAASPKEIIWTKGATESINLVASCLTATQLNGGRNILISGLEHHANLVPWQQMAARLGLNLQVMPLDAQGCLLLEDALAMIDADTALVAIAHVSNALGNINPIGAIIDKARKYNALSLIDGTQALGHFAVDVGQLGCDFYVFSGHKIYGPTGIGVLYGRQSLLESMSPYQYGGEMIEQVTYSHTSFAPLPYKFEAGTPNMAGVMGLAAALEFIDMHRQTITAHEQALYAYLLKGLSAITGVRLWGDLENSVALQSFTLEGLNSYDVATLLNQQNIALRVGHHCAMPLMHRLGIDGTLRVSLACYNTQAELDSLFAALEKAIAELSGANDIPSSPVPVRGDQDLVAKLKAARGWDESYRQIMLAGKELARLPDALKSAELQVFGCESQVWLKCEFVAGAIQLQGDSPSKIVRGLLAVIFAAIDGQRPEQVLSFDIKSYLAQLGLASQLSESRGNGLAAVVQRIHQYSREQLSKI